MRTVRNSALRLATRTTTTEATTYGKTRSGGLGSRARGNSDRAGAVRAFRDIRGTEYHHHPNTVVLDRNASGDDHVLRRHWLVVCADRGGPAGRQDLG